MRQWATTVRASRVCVCVCVITHTVTQSAGVFDIWISVLLLAPAGDNCGQQSRATIPFSSMSWFSLLQIDVDVEEPETSENPTQSFEIDNIVWRCTQLLAVIIYIIWSMHNMILFRSRAPGLLPEHPEGFRIFTEHGQRLSAPRHCDTSTVNRAHGTVIYMIQKALDHLKD